MVHRDVFGGDAELADLKLTLSTAIRVDGPYQDQFRGSMGHIAEDVEDVEPHAATRWLHDTRQEPGVGSRGRGCFSASACSHERSHAMEM